jgi:hypothetical protein
LFRSNGRLPGCPGGGTDQEIAMANINPPPGRTGYTTYYVVGAIIVIAVIAIIYFVGRTPDTAMDTTTTPPATEAPAGTTGTEPATPPAGGTTTTQ